MIGLAILGVVVIMALFANLIVPHDPFAQNLDARFVPPFWMEGGSWKHIFGTDHLGRDYFSRIIYGARISLVIGISVACIAAVIGVALGVSAGYFGGYVDLVITFLITARLAVPVILVALAIAALYGSSVKTLIIILGLLLWDRYAIVMRASVQQIRELDYVQAAKIQGCSTLRILAAEVLPNVLNNLIVIATLEMAHAIILEAALSFLGLGVQPPLPSWGLMVSEGREQILFDPWLITIPGAFLFMLVLAINLVGDGLRDVLAPDSRA
ncbi:ABC transporter permease [Pseudorhodoplanes sp.]|uniref:ABC transporter permease n=1 Tax=Pseudorhodoplanes sp. TaxID=1934341 RepID=UPI003D102D47